MTLPCIYWTAIHPNGQNTNYVSNGTRIRGRIFPEVVFACMPTALLLEPNKFRHCAITAWALKKNVVLFALECLDSGTAKCIET